MRTKSHQQERFLAQNTGKLSVTLVVGVGAAFDLLSGNLSEAPDWMKRNGLQWFYRLIKGRRRLWCRYLINNPSFICLVLLQRFGPRPFALGSSSETRR